MSQERDSTLRASELIAELQEAIKQHGDLPVQVWDYHEQECLMLTKNNIKPLISIMGGVAFSLPENYKGMEGEKQLVIHPVP